MIHFAALALAASSEAASPTALPLTVVLPGELRVRTRAEPVFSEELVSQYRGARGWCAVTVRIDEAGVPFEVAAGQSCPEPFRRPVEAAVLEWRWRPPLSDGEPIRAQTAVSVRVRVR